MSPPASSTKSPSTSLQKSAATKSSSTSSSSSTLFAPYTPPTGEHIKPTTRTVTINSTPLSQSFRHLFALLVGAHFYTRFGALVADPVSTLLRDALPLAAAQVAYCVICLPVVSGGEIKAGLKALGGGKDEKRKGASASAAGSAGSASATSKKKSGKGGELGVGGRISTAVLALILSLVPSTPLIMALTILLGAPLTTHFAHTALLALHISLLSLPPLFYVRGVDARAWRETAAALLPFDEVWGGSLGAVLGAWLGAVPIPLDWDREWQKWPVTVVAGAYVGWVVGRYIGEFVIKGWRVNMDQE